jgi:hypothetical protein
MAGEEPAIPAETQPDSRSEEEIVEAIAFLLAQRGYRFVPDAELPGMTRALRPFLVAA